MSILPYFQHFSTIFIMLLAQGGVSLPRLGRAVGAVAPELWEVSQVPQVRTSVAEKCWKMGQNLWYHI